MKAVGSDSKSFVREFMPKVSRTFALAIKFLPPGLRHPVNTAYLLCRVADTIEDSDIIPKFDKKAKLIYLKEILERGYNGNKISADNISPLFESIELSLGDDYRLLANSKRLFEILDELPTEQKKIIYHWAAEMAGGMAEYSQLPSGNPDNICALENIADWDSYCYYVAGTVGHMMTELFVDHYNLDDSISSQLRRFDDSFGLGLQKVNVIKDVPVDRSRGVCFLPSDIIKKYDLKPDFSGLKIDNRSAAALIDELSTNAISHLDDAISYSTIFPTKYKGIRMFLIVPLFLAVVTLGLVRKHPVQTLTGPPVKISRADVIRLVGAAGRASKSNDILIKYYQKLKSKGGFEN